MKKSVINSFVSVLAAVVMGTGSFIMMEGTSFAASISTTRSPQNSFDGNVVSPAIVVGGSSNDPISFIWTQANLGGPIFQPIKLYYGFQGASSASQGYGWAHINYAHGLKDPIGTCLRDVVWDPNQIGKQTSTKAYIANDFTPKDAAGEIVTVVAVLTINSTTHAWQVQTAFPLKSGQNIYGITSDTNSTVILKPIDGEPKNQFPRWFTNPANWSMD